MRDVDVLSGRSGQLAHKFGWWVKYYGVDLAILGAAVKALSFARPALAPTEWYKRVSSRRFDRRFGVDTAGTIGLDDLDFTADQKQQANHYQPTASVTFALIVSALRIPYERYTFVDYGSGMGRALILAAQFPFRKIIGVELSARLDGIARRNIAGLRTERVRCAAIASVCQDATTYALPEDPLVLYFFHPFKAPVLRLVMDNLRDSLHRVPRPVIVLYQRPLYTRRDEDLTDVFDHVEFLRRAPLSVHDRRWDIYDNGLAIGAHAAGGAAALPTAPQAR